MLFGFADSNTPGTAPAQPDDLLDEEFDEEEGVGEEIGKTLVALMPWGVSILFHVVLVVIAFFLVWTQVIKAEEEQTIIPNTQLSETPGAPLKMEEVTEESSSTPMTVPVVDPTVTTPTPTVTNTPIPTKMMGAKFQGGQTGGPLGNTNGSGDFGAGMFGSGGNARKIAFIVDASGSMVDVLPFVVNELKRSINALQPAQNITIIFFSGEGIYEVPGGGGVKGLRSCTPKFKDDIREWVTLSNFKFETGGRGSQHVEDAILRALSYKPQMVFLLSDNLTGGGQGATQHEIFQGELMDAIRKANNKLKPPAVFHTIQFLYEDPLVRAGLTGTLRLIADETDGDYRFIDDEALKLK